MKLYELPMEYAVLDSALVENAGELTPELEKRLDDFLRSGKDKIEAGVMVMRGLEMEVKACKEEAKRLTERAASIENNAERLKALILYALDGAFGGKVRTGLFTIWGQTSAAQIAVEVAPSVDLARLPEAYVRVHRELAKDAIKEAVKRGEDVSGWGITATDVPGTRFLRVR
jgi:hypothetical protein